MSKSRSFGWESIGLGVAVGTFTQLSVVATIPVAPTQAQIIPDATLGTERSSLTPNANVPTLPSPVDLIEGGAPRGSNLFHSFLEFNVNNGQQVYFANPIGIETIFTRVTGNHLSNILGTLGVNGNASLFLLNPNGIVFGPNARLDINGSFLATTANSFQFPNGNEFSATNPQAPPLLTISVPLGVQYGSQSGGITNTGNLTVGQDLTLAAGNLDLQGQVSASRDLTLQAWDTVRVRDSAATPFIASAGGKLIVQGNRGVDIFALNHPNSGFYSGTDMVLRSANTVGGDAHYSAGGNFRIETLDGILGNLSSPYDPIILSSGDVSLGDYTGGSLHILAGGSVTLGNVEITGTDIDGNTIHPGNTTPVNNTQTIASLASFTLSDNTPITIQGNIIPTLDVRAGVNWAALGGFPVPDPTIIGTLPNSPLVPASGASITVNGTITNAQPDGFVLLTNQFQPNTATGNIVVNGINTSSGNSGSIIIDSRGNFTPRGNLDTSTSGTGGGGDIRIRTVGDVRLDGVQLVSNTQPFSSGNAGNISVAARSLFLDNGGQITSQSQDSATGNSGNITLNVTDTLSLTSNVGGGQPSAIFTLTQRRSQGNGGNISITTGNLILKDGSEILANNFGNRAGTKAGDITIRATGQITLDGYRDNNGNNSGSGIGSNIRFGREDGSTGAKQAGTIDIQAAGLLMQNGGYIASKVEQGESGQGGNISLNITGSMQLRGVSPSGNESGLFSNVESGAVGNAGNISIRANNLSLLNGGAIVNSVDPNGQGNAGDITINVPGGNITVAGQTVVTDNNTDDTSDDVIRISKISNAVGQGAVGNGGTISITTGNLFVTDGARLDSSMAGIGERAGDIFIQADNGVFLNQGSQLSTTVQSSETSSPGGNIGISAKTIDIQNNSALTANSNSPYSAPGNISLRGTEQVSINQSRITSQSRNNEEDYGEIRIEAPTGSVVLNQATVNNQNQGSALAGDIFINARDRIAITNSNILADGYLGRIVVGSGLEPQTLEISNSTLKTTNDVINGAQDAGGIYLGVAGLTSITNSQLLGFTVGAGEGGSIGIETSSLLLDNSQLNVTTQGSGNAGNVIINARDTVNLRQRSRIESQVDSTGIGNGGNIEITAPTVAITDGASIKVDNNSTNINATGATPNAGKIRVQVNTLTLDNGASITAETASGNGGDIEIVAKEQLLMRRNSVISTSAGSLQNPGNGGRITINVKDGFVIAVPGENSDIIANAFGGQGGNINIQAVRVLGMIARSGLTPEQLLGLRNNSTNDISVSSDVGLEGTIQIQNLGTDPVQGLMELPTDIVDPSGLIVQACRPRSNRDAKEQSEFVVTGRGGLPPSPDDPLISGAVPTPWVTRDIGTASNSVGVTLPVRTAKTQLVEAQGMVFGSNGEIILTAEASTATRHPSGFSSYFCP